MTNKDFLAGLGRVAVLVALLALLLWFVFGARWLSLHYALPVALLAAVQIGYWVMFFATGATDPSLGVVREMLPPMLATVGRWGPVALLVSWGFVLRRALRSPAAAD